MMKKIIALSLALVLTLSLAGCGMSRSVTKEEVADIDYGKIENGIYKNTHFGIAYLFNADWNSDTQEEIWQRNDWDSSKDLREQMLKSLKKPNYFWELHTESKAQDATLDVSIDNVSVLADPDLSQEEYAEYAAEQAVDHWEQIKATDIEIELIERNVADKTCHGFLITCKYQGDSIYYQSLYIKKGIYAAEIKATCIGENVIDEILSDFYAIENQPS